MAEESNDDFLKRLREWESRGLEGKYAEGLIRLGVEFNEVSSDQIRTLCRLMNATPVDVLCMAVAYLHHTEVERNENGDCKIFLVVERGGECIKRVELLP